MVHEVRKATLEDREAITQLIAESARLLSREHYADAQIEAAIAHVFGVDTSLIDDETYFVFRRRSITPSQADRRCARGSRPVCERLRQRGSL